MWKDSQNITCTLIAKPNQTVLQQQKKQKLKSM